jgi:ribosome-associated protein
MNYQELAQIAASAAVDKKATRIKLLDLKGQTDLCDVTLVCSAENEKQVAAVAQAIEERCKKVAGVRPLSVEGMQLGNWVLLDYGSMICHVFLSEARDYYAFDTLWPKAAPIHVDGLTSV